MGTIKSKIQRVAVSVVGIVLTTVAVASASPSVQSRVKFGVHPVTYFGGFRVPKFQVQDGTYCPDHSLSVFVIGGKGGLDNSLPGVDVFERGVGTCHVATQSDSPVVIRTVKINGRTATVATSCYGVATTSCTVARISKYGGHISWSLPGNATYGATQITVDGYNVSYTTLLRIARGVRTSEA